MRITFKWFFSMLLLIISVICYAGSIILARPDVYPSSVPATLLFLLGLAFFTLSLIFTPKKPVYDAIRYVFLFSLLVLACILRTWGHAFFIVLVSLVFIPFVIRDCNRGKTKAMPPVYEEDEQEYFGDWFDEREAKRKCQAYFEKQGLSHIRETRAKRGYTEYTARDKYGQEWKFRCERNGSKINISKTPGNPPDLKPDALRSIEILEMFSDK